MLYEIELVNIDGHVDHYIVNGPSSRGNRPPHAILNYGLRMADNRFDCVRLQISRYHAPSIGRAFDGRRQLDMPMPTAELLYERGIQ